MSKITIRHQRIAIMSIGSITRTVIRVTIPRRLKHRLFRASLYRGGPLLRITARSGLPEAAAEQTIRTMNRLSEQFASFVVDGIANGSVRPVDPTIAAQLINGMINASASVKRWVPGATIDNVADLYACPLFMGLLRRR